MLPASTQIFYDGHHRRGRRLSQLLLVLCACLVAVYSIGLWSITRTPKLGSLPLAMPPADPTRHLLSFEKPVEVPVGKPGITVLYSGWDEPGQISLQRHLDAISRIVPQWLHLRDAAGAFGQEDPTTEANLIKLVRTHRGDAVIEPSFDAYNPVTGEWEGALLEAMLRNPAARTTCISGLVGWLHQEGMNGITLDFQDLPLAYLPVEQIFARELVASAHQESLSVAWVAPVDSAPSLGDIVDRVYLTAYDEHWGGAAAGPVASAQWFMNAVSARLADPDAKKYTFILGSSGYDWPPQGTGVSVGFSRVMQLAAQNHISPVFDAAAGNPVLRYRAGDGEHAVWYLDGVTAANELHAFTTLPVTRFGLADLGNEDPTFWQALTGRQASPSHVLGKITYDYDMQYLGDGDVTKVEDTPRTGIRTLSVTTGGYVSDERLNILPASFVVERFGQPPDKKIALTFDDGPDLEYTPDILQILSQYQVEATFFLIGDNAAKHPDLVRRIYDEGHELGNHTYYHSNVAVISPLQLRLEVNATQRLLESVTGHRTTLFRPPYAIDGEPQTAAELRPLFLTSQLGYYTVNESIDPNDWQPGKQASRIASEVLAGAAHGGHIILLHDGGGNRSQTVKALPAIIRGLRAQGFEIVSIADLLGVPEDRVMPAVQAPDRLLGRVNQVGYTANDLFQDSIYWLFIASVILGLFRLVGIASLAILQRRAQRPLEASSYHPSVAVLVPAYNEERVILTTVETILDSSYSNLEVIVVDDGSSDSTLDRLAKNFPEMARLQLLTKANGGKAAALNYAIERTKADIIVTIDADTIIDPRAVGLLVPHFSEAGVAAVAGNAKVGNRLNILTRWQALEYIMGQNLDRRAFHRLNCICVVPGAIGAWRREAVIQAGGFRNDTLAEDTDLTLRLLEANWRITYEDAAIAYTEAPDTLETFFKQRFRWVYGTLQAIWKRRHVLLRRRYRALGLVAIPNMLVFQVFLPLLGPIMDILMLASVILTAIQRAQHPESYSSDSVRKIFFYYVFFLLLEIITGITAFLLEKQEDWKLLLWIPVQRFFYRQLLYTTVIRSVLAAVRGSQVHWNKLERKATVRVVANRDVKLN